MIELNLKKSFDGFGVNVSLDLSDEITVLFGPSGAGKTLLLNMISGIVVPDEGVLKLGGVTLYDSNNGINVPIRNRRIGYLFQDYALFPHMTVAQNIAFGLNAMKSSVVSAKVNELMSVMRLTGLEARYPKELSGGQKQRAALARTLAVEPRVLLLDEPFSALDNQVREKLRADLRKIHEIFPITTIVVTHDLDEAYMLGDRIAVINNGAIEQSSGREEVFYRPATRSVARFMGIMNIFDCVVAGVDADGIIVHNSDMGSFSAQASRGCSFREGQDVTVCIRPEEVLLIRPDRELTSAENVVEAVVTSFIGKGSTSVIMLRSDSGKSILKVELPNFVVRKLAIAPGVCVRVMLKKENLWVIPGR